MKGFWNRLSITRKTFLIFALVFIAFFTIWMSGHFFFFGSYYENITSKALRNSVKELADEYVTLDSGEKIKEAIVRYANNGDAYYSVLSENGDILFMVSYELVIKPSDGGENMRFSLDNAIHDESFIKTKFDEDSLITVTYAVFDDNSAKANIYFPDSIEYNGKTWKNNFGRPGIRPPDSGAREQKTPKLLSVTGKIVSVTLPNQQSSRFSVQRNEAAAVLMNFKERLLTGYSPKNGLNEEYIFNEFSNNNEYCVAVRKITKNGNDEYICGVLPMKNIFEAISATRGFTVILFLLMLVLMCFVAWIFSHAITKPIIEINNVTEKMKKLDFSKKCTVDSGDELGRLAENVNEMSDKLDETIGELVEANKKLKKDIEREKMLEEQRKDFVAAASHELKTPLAIIRAYSEGLIDGVFKNRQEHYLKVIIEEIEKMDKLVVDMIENSRLEASTMKPELKEHDLCAFVNKIAQRFVSPCKAENIKIEIDIPQKQIIKCFDGTLIEQVLTNFITNAMKNTHDGVIRVGVNDLCVWVENDGAHIPEDELDKIWDRFYKVDKARNRSVGGTGLGLSIAKNILLLHGADYKAENTPNGVRFSFSLK